MIRLSRAALAAAAAATLLAPVQLGARPGRPAAAPVRIEPARLASLEAFIDGVMAQQVATREVAGAVVIVVHRGRVILSRGYGHADVERGLPVDPQRTLFRPGSVSKLFTWVALMQQIEAGRVKLDADVNDYIDFKIPPFEGQPIRVRDLFSHAPGMSDLAGFAVTGPDKLVPYQSWIKDHAPQRLWAPGTEISYSNYGAALAGYIVERVSGTPFPDYVEQRLFAPLGMNSTSFREPLPAALAARMALGYDLKDGRMVAQPYEYYSAIMPAGSAASSAPDIAQFMLAMLGGGRLGDARILRPESVRFLESNSLANAPSLPGMAHGFMVRRQAGPRLVGHGGNTGDFHSDLILAPEADLGFFVSTTGGPGAYGARTELVEAITGRLFPQRPAPAWSGSAPETATEGAYRANRRDYNRTPDPKRDIRISRPAPGIVVIDNDGRKTRWRRIGPAVYEQVTATRADGPFDRIEFYGSDDARRLSFASQPHMTWHLVKP